LESEGTAVESVDALLPEEDVFVKEEILYEV